MTTAARVSTREYAHVLDIPIPGPEEQHGCNPSPDAIGGCYSMGWYSYYRDRTTGEIYRVYESDGVYGGKCAYRDVDRKWRDAIYLEVLVPRFREVAANHGAEIRISRNERIAMQGFTHTFLFETAEGKRDGRQSDQGLEGGLVGHFHGIPVICDLDQPEVLPPPQ